MNNTNLKNNKIISSGNPEQLRNLIVYLMRELGGDDNIWKDRGIELIDALLPCLTYMYEKDETSPSIDVLRKYIQLENIVELVKRDDLPETVINPLKKYLNDLAGFKMEEAIMGKISPIAFDQQNYRIMQFNKVLKDLSKAYNYRV